MTHPIIKRKTKKTSYFPCLTGVANTECIMQTDITKSFGVHQSPAFKTHEPSSHSQYAIHRDSNRCMMSHFI